jgi:hypothetical protein
MIPHADRGELPRFAPSGASDRVLRGGSRPCKPRRAASLLAAEGGVAAYCSA